MTHIGAVVALCTKRLLREALFLRLLVPKSISAAVQYRYEARLKPKSRSPAIKIHNFDALPLGI